MGDSPTFFGMQAIRCHGGSAALRNVQSSGRFSSSWSRKSLHRLYASRPTISVLPGSPRHFRGPSRSDTLQRPELLPEDSMAVRPSGEFSSGWAAAASGTGAAPVVPEAEEDVATRPWA
jgi:hypothetical protein